MPLVEPFRISSGAVSEKDGIVVRVETDDLVGYGESSPMAGSSTPPIRPRAAGGSFDESLAPALLGSHLSTAGGGQVVSALPGSNFAKAGLETAFWDIEARRAGKPLFECLAEDRTRRVWSGGRALR